MEEVGGTSPAVKSKPRSCISCQSECLRAACRLRGIPRTALDQYAPEFAGDPSGIQVPVAGRMCGRVQSILLDPAVLHIGLQKKY
jgi:hypothetical protein